ncbi:bifunctional homocysteine S-methyltransferase/5,10-methylenetetrahydrofolate reductase [Paenibacillus sp. J31TS4]|uniref:bifunctional homocysteine S-methyltransferase/methylenetetrahydrofolate reductase n=1 Tax=Paenibacillus sp. J31TS4 TaxID=2807195 RepID=UPI001B07B8BD|nr:bifunctional homocysteine S-methyltransferase/methylenetetrahydrofolate reductase [Paenibacillus sp. J31TS4]GIP36726.1 bifunctional homocysteine S-methyltransferase/5,10-methylenetetrahydrofolate reductase [Paenibacillus sp. J31TS4]
MKPDLREILKDTILTGDGAMGTYLYQLGFPIGISYEEFNLVKPEVILDVHRRYYEAGARLIETNTFSANRENLSKYGLENEVGAINRAGAALAKQAAGPDAYVMGAVGSIRGSRRRHLEASFIEQELREQLDAVLSEGVDGILLETFYELDEMLLALRTVRAMSGLPVICQFATEGSGMTTDGVPVSEAFIRLEEAGADVVGFNCHSGPNGILRALEKLGPAERLPYSIFPNAGLPGFIDGRYTYRATPEYFAQSAIRFADLGARIVGGCCGTTPEHIQAIAEALAGYRPGAKADAADGRGERIEIRPAAAEPKRTPGAEATRSVVDLVKERHTVIVELDPPRSLSVDKFMEGAEALKQAGADFITMADNSLAMTRMSNVSTGYLVKDKVGVPPLLHIACRDRNSIGTQSHLMGLHALGINHVLLLTGDPAKFGDLPGASSVYDLTSFDLIRMAKQLNDGVSFSGKPIKQKANFVIGAAFDPNVKYIEKAVQRMEKKIAAGADYFMTQPVYDPAMIDRLYEATKHITVPIFLGFMPVISGRNAEFLHNEVPGIRIPDEVRARMAGLEGEEGRRVGVEICKELLDYALDKFHGIYFMTPMLHYGMTAELTRYVRERTNRLAPLVPGSKIH